MNWHLIMICVSWLVLGHRSHCIYNSAAREYIEPTEEDVFIYFYCFHNRRTILTVIFFTSRRRTTKSFYKYTWIMVIVLSNENNEWNVIYNVANVQVPFYVVHVFSKANISMDTEYIFYIYHMKLNLQLFITSRIFLSDVLLNNYKNRQIIRENTIFVRNITSSVDQWPSGSSFWKKRKQQQNFLSK